MALPKTVLHILFHVHNRPAAVQECPAFKMKIQAPEIHIDRPHSGDPVIAYVRFGMDEPRRVFIDLHACVQQGRIVRFGHEKYHRFIRDSRHQDAHIHSALRRQAERILHLIADQQIRRSDIDIIFRLIQNIDIDILSKLFIVQRRVRIGDNITVAFKRICMPSARIL